MHAMLVYHRRPGDACDDRHGPAARRTREGIDLEDLLEEGRHLQEKANRYSCAQASQRMRAKPCASTPHARNLSAT